MFNNRTVTSIHLWSISIMSLFVALFIALVIYEEYNDFEREAKKIRKDYLIEQKSIIFNDINRVLKFIDYSYKNNKSKIDTIKAIEYLYGKDYIFIFDNLNGMNISDSLFKVDMELIQELIKVSKHIEGGYVKSQQISYAKSFNPWKWTVTRGVYLDKVEQIILEERKKLKYRLIKYMMEILSLSVIIFGFGTIILSIVNHIINKEINTFSLFFQKASKGYTLIEEGDIGLLEFKKMVKYVNNMVIEIHKRKNRLEELNLSLERIVEAKTEELQRLVKAQDSFIKHSIHEINTPLAVIMTYIDIYKMKYSENNPYISKIEAGAKIISTIYDDLGYMVKKDRLEYEKEKIDLSKFLFERLDFFNEIASGNRRKIILDVDNNIEVFFNTLELQRVIDNNLSNAIKFAKKDTDILVTLKQKDSIVLLSFVTNSNKILDTKEIFKAFHREKSEEVGFGLGLEIVKSICDKENIEVIVLSDKKRTIFEYRFRGYIL